MATCHTSGAESSVASSLATRCVALVGNPNTGKTTLFNALTGLTQHVGNYAGVTVEKKTGILRNETTEVMLVDLPGCYSVAARSPDEMVAIDVLLGRMPDCPPPEMIVVIVDASNIERNLYLATQLLEIGRPVVLCMNMIDVAESSGVRIDCGALSEELGATVIPMSAKSGRGIDTLRSLLLAPTLPSPPKPAAEYPQRLHDEAVNLHREFGGAGDEDSGVRDGLSLFESLRVLLEVEASAEKRWCSRLGNTFTEWLHAARTRLEADGHDLAHLEANMRYEKIGALLERHTQRATSGRSPLFTRIDSILTHRFFGIVIFLSMMAMIFQAVYAWAGPLMDLIDGVFQFLGAFAGAWLPEGAWRSFVTDGLIGGVGAVVIFLPQILILFLFIAILEDCGYLPRAAFLMDRILTKGGLSGNAFIPLLSSFACAVPGIMATRVIENRRDRLIALLVAPLMSCSARLPVYTIMIAAFVPSIGFMGGVLNLQGLVLLLIYALGASLSIPMALVLRRTVLREERDSLVMLELPIYRWPTPRNVFMRMYIQGKAFLVRAGTVIFAVSVLVWFLSYYPRPVEIAEDFEARRVELVAESGIAADAEELPVAVTDALDEIDREEAGTYVRQSFLGRGGHWIEPLVRPLGWDWKIGTAVLASFPAREVVIAVLGIVYDLGGDEDEESTDLIEKLRAARHEDGRPVFTVPVALSIMVFFALCAQCAATLAVIRRETNSWRWPAFVFCYMTLLAYGGAFLTYQIGSLFGAA